MAKLSFVDASGLLRASAASAVVVGRRDCLASADVREALPRDVGERWDAMLESLRPGDTGASTTTWSGQGGPAKVTAVLLPEACSRHNSPARPHAITRGVRAALKGAGAHRVLLALDDADHAVAAGCAVARALPLYDRKAERSTDMSVDVGFIGVGVVTDAQRAEVSRAADGVRLAGRLTDMPASELHTDAFVSELEVLASRVGASCSILRGRQLEEAGYGGLWGVGKAAVHPPALVVLTHDPAGASETVCWIGKGIVYDTGGLSLKGKAAMPGMKVDMGGAAAVAGAFLAAASGKAQRRIHAVFCLAENSVGPESTRPDDVLEMYSGKTVEVNNTDAEGRLVLGDGIAHAVRHLSPDVLVDLATLTGAQLVATGLRHAAIVCDDDALERRAIDAGRASGDLVHPLPYCPEFFRGEFRSRVADLKNSVKNRSNAQSSCAAQFVAEHKGETSAPWLHVDLAGPAVQDERGTGFGVALLLRLFRDA